MGQVVVFAPSPVVSVTVEDHDGGDPEIHIHAAGQGIWQARMLRTLGMDVIMCCVLAGETGDLLRHMIEGEGIELRAVDGGADNGAYIHDRRGDERATVAESGGDRLSRHDLDELYGITLSAGMDAGTVILSGATSEDLVPTDIYRRLAADLGAVGSRVLVDLSGERLAQSLVGGVTVVKVADDELTDDDRAPSSKAEDVVKAMHALVDEGAEHVIVTRAEEPALMLTDGEVSEVVLPSLEVMDHHGAGDSLTAGVAAALADGATFTEGVTLGSAAGALNVTRHGLGSGNRDTVHKLRRLVEVKPYNPRS